MGTALSRKEQEELAALNGESPPALSAQEQAELDALNGGPAPAAAAAPAAPAAPAQPKKEPGFFEGLAARMQDKPLGSRLTGAGKVFRDSMKIGRAHV